MTITIDSVIHSNDLFQILHVLHCLVFFAGDVKPVSPSFQAVSTFFDVNVFRKAVSGVIGYLLRKLSFNFKLIILVQDIWINSFRVTNSTMFCQFFTDLSILLDFSSFGIICPFRFFRSFFRPLWYFWIFGYCRLFGVLSVFLVFLFCRSFLRCKNFYFISLTS
jgi:hypothetical protein